jgi:hypothetical protein
MYIWHEISASAWPGLVALLNPSACVSCFDFDEESAMRSVFASNVNTKLIKTTLRSSSQMIIPFMLSILHLFL